MSEPVQQRPGRAQEPTYFVAWAGWCPNSDCGVHYLATASGIPEEHRPDTTQVKRLGDTSTAVCICGTTLDVSVVAIGVEPYRVALDDEDEA